MNTRTLVLSAALLVGSLVPFGFGQAASPDAAAATKPKVVITDDNLSEQLPPKAASDDAIDSAQASPAVAAPGAMSAEEIKALETAITDKRAKLTDVQDHVIAMAAKLEQETDEEQKTRDSDYVKASQLSIDKLTAQLTEMEKKLADAKASAEAQPASSDQPNQTGHGIDETSTGAPDSK
jgi:uncharacterized coiled-coil protein SlyX